ncbi:hypothetical protein ACFC1R_37160 [Kitasatospora sp. NPDC056138]|uniref:hypothetical protein n=1 Tax=Kitasatospora sp. NPDC056138 TaxID=3345724 RepID=UPI0035E30507
MTGPDFVPPEKRQPGLTIRSYRIAPDGTRHDDTGPVTVDADDVSAHATHPAAGWPACACPIHGGRS